MLQMVWRQTSLEKEEPQVSKLPRTVLLTILHRLVFQSHHILNDFKMQIPGSHTWNSNIQIRPFILLEGHPMETKREMDLVSELWFQFLLLPFIGHVILRTFIILLENAGLQILVSTLRTRQRAGSDGWQCTVEL